MDPLLSSGHFLLKYWRLMLAFTILVIISIDISYHYELEYNLARLAPRFSFPHAEMVPTTIATIRQGTNKVTVNQTETTHFQTVSSISSTHNSTMPTQTTVAATSAYPSIPGLDSMDKALQLPPMATVHNGSKEPIVEYSQRRDYEPIIYRENLCAPLGGGDTAQRIPVKLKNVENFNTKSDLYLLMAVKSMCGSVNRREAIRHSWGNESWAVMELGVRIRVVFLLGACENKAMQEKVNAEDKETSDIIQWDFFESFRNLTRKTCLFLQWYTRNCKQVPYIFQGDDDVFVNTKNIVEYLKEITPDARNELFTGSLLVNSPRITNTKWKYYVSENLYPDKFYPPYVSGGGFLMSGNMAVRLFSASLKTRIIPIDDAFIGTLLKAIKVSPKNDHGFKSWGMGKIDDCRLAKIKTFHKVTPHEMVEYWRWITEIDLSKCDPETDDVLRRQNR